MHRPRPNRYQRDVVEVLSELLVPPHVIQTPFASMTASTTRVPPTSPEAVAASVSALRASFRSGATRDLKTRLAQLQQLWRLLSENVRELQDALFQDLRKPPAETLIAELAPVRAEISLHEEELAHWAAPERVWINVCNLPGRSYVQREPLGVVCVLSTWNYPVQLSLWPLVGAISAGNCVLLRLPSDDTCVHTSELLLKLVAAYLDPRFVRAVHGGVPATQAMLTHKFDLILCTGGVTMGRIVAQAAAKTLTPTILELGGKSPTLVDETCDVAVTARRITWAAFMNAGQTCLRPDYVMVSAKVGDELVAAIQREMAAFFGEDPQKSASYGRLITPKAFDRAAEFLERDAEFVVFGGAKDRDDQFVAPTLLNFKKDVDAFTRSAVMQEEVFSPLLPVVYYETLDDAIEFVNAREKPLALYLYSSDYSARTRVLAETSSGSACVNDSIMQSVNLNLPFGGVGVSGMGSYHGKYSFDAFSHKKSVLIKYALFDAPQRYMPYSNSALKIVLMLLKPLPNSLIVLGAYAFISLGFVVIGLILQIYRGGAVIDT
ncbi:Aldehyde dehydrogenase, dimeric [Phytophthora fragariae]|uniref:Aldehyde dehydrogenase n=2 Tax=Phytophthora fragariae TaxID=53985 RepID=A0A6A3UPS2_9STRA|nr:Aldehyde dehydrogenase, dimeric [Phytophthora fragariae]KAE9026366.1 Aldehyde dehydrogenase, dimeric [Phytophthora fragariae]KAE9133495.1 Aldehyde dehydrogenase, dimeric [Phytophthora fragariae]KAE9153241.1 Aldehyde dehydrogenase, dimeric [Phytophthora fragariae]KAE9231063.1 Aldehyde dehydrogenase, dimeric [Phytophthora fragariae]